MINDVVVAFPNAATVTVVALERGCHVLQCGILNVFEAVPHVPFPPVKVVEVMLARGVEAIGLDRAVHETAGACTGWRFFSTKLEIAADTRDANWSDTTLHPRDEVKIVAALGHEHGGVAFVTAAPLAAHIPDGHVVIGNVFHCLHVDNLADSVGTDLAADGGIKRGVAQYVANADLATEFAGGIDQLPEFVL